MTAVEHHCTPFCERPCQHWREMPFDTFRESIRLGVIAGAYDIKWTIMFITRHGWLTTKCVPADKRHYVLRHLTRYANR